MQHVRHAPARKTRGAGRDCMMALLEHTWKDPAALLAAPIRMAAGGGGPGGRDGRPAIPGKGVVGVVL
jgi:hypothetical protein